MNHTAFANADVSQTMLSVEVNENQPEMKKIQNAWLKCYERTTNQLGYKSVNTRDAFNNLK